MGGKVLNTILMLGIIASLIVLAVDPIVIGYNVNKNSVVLSSTNTLNLISKSSGLENPDKEEGKTELELADINNDGHLDIISVGDHGSPFVNSGEHGIMVWIGDGDGAWTVHQIGNFGYGGCAIGDLNLDGYLDIAWGIHHDWGSGGFGDTLIGAAIGDGSGSSWTPWATGLASSGETWGMFATALADFDCNGRLDIISQSFGSGNGLHLYENHGDGTWSQTWALTGDNARYTIETCDINADGYPDFVATRTGATILIGDGDFGFTINHNGLPSGTIMAIDCGDMNNDGCNDVVFALGSSGIFCYIYDKNDNKWVSASDGLPPSGNYYMTQFGDLNGDGFLDIVAYSDPTGYVFLGDGNGNWVADTTWTMPSPGGYSALRVDGDIDHDGREDIIVQAKQSGFPFYRNQLRVYSPWSEPTELSVRVTIPHGDETFRSGSIRNIRWLSGVPPSQGESAVEIQISIDGDSGPWDTIVKDVPNNGCYQWLVDASGSENCRIKVIVTTSSSSASAMSVSNFQIIGFNVDANGPYQGSIGSFVQFTGYANNGTSPYEYLWDFGDGNISDKQNPTHNYAEAGNYTVILSVTDAEDITIRDSTWALINGDNNPPSKPIIDGPTSGKPNTEYDFTFNAIDPDGDDIKYLIDWGEGTSDTTLFVASGTSVDASHTWADEGTYTITAKAEDTNGLIGPEATKAVTMPRTKAINRPFLNFLQNLTHTNLFSLLQRLGVQ
jgi:hypothetical protein